MLLCPPSFPALIPLVPPAPPLHVSWVGNLTERSVAEWDVNEL
jgi:hypothetical protein